MKIESFKRWIPMIGEHTDIRPVVDGNVVTVEEFVAGLAKHDAALAAKAKPYLEAAAELRAYVKEKTETTFGSTTWGL